MQRSQVLAVAVVGLLVVAPAVAVGQVDDHEITGHPGIDVSVPDNEVRPGAETSLTVVVFNDGNVTNGSVSNPQLEQRVTTARALRVRIEDDHDAPISVTTNEQVVSTLPDGQSAPVQFGITVEGDAEPGEYRLPVNVTYNYTEEIDPRTSEYNRTSANRTFNATLVVTETAQFEVVGVESNARVGATGTVNVTLANTGHETARNASVTLTSRNGDLTVGGAASASRYVGGAWDPGERRTVAYRIGVARSASQQRYAFTAEVGYENSDGNARQSNPLSLGVVPDPEQTFSIVDTDHAVAVDDEGRVTVTLRNDGPITVRDASVTLQSGSGDIVFGESATASQFVGTWAPGENRTVAVNATALPDATVRNYTVTATVSYDDREGDPGESRPLGFGLRPGPEREYAFATEDVESNLRVGEDGTLSGTITNTGDRVAHNVVVVFESESQTVTPAEREVPVGTLAPGDSATFEFDLDVGGSAEAGPRQYTLRPRYRDADDEQQTGESFDVQAEIRPERAVFAVDVAEATVPRGETALLEVTLRNAGNETVTDISGQLFADSPISVTDDESFVGRLEPGEETTIVFEIGAGQSALTKTYPVEMDFQYDDADGDTQLSDTYRVPVQVTEPEDDGGIPLPAIAGGAVLLVVLVGAAAYRRFG